MYADTIFLGGDKPWGSYASLQRSPGRKCIMNGMSSRLSQLSYFRIPILVLVLGVGLAGLARGWGQALVVALLAVLEISLSFDNAVINASILRRLTNFWQQIFLTVGMLIAVVGMRLFFPIAIVAVTAQLGLGQGMDLALDRPVEAGGRGGAARPSLAALCG